MPDNPNTASPVTRSAEVEHAIEFFFSQLTNIHNEGTKHRYAHGKCLLAYIASLEAQPKPQSDEGLPVPAITGKPKHRAAIDDQLDRLKTNGGQTLMLTPRLGVFGLPFEWVLFYLDESGQRNLIPITNAGICWNKHGIINLQSALSRQAPVPTSGAVEVAEKIANELCLLFKNPDCSGRILKQIEPRMLPIIQQAMDGSPTAEQKFKAGVMAHLEERAKYFDRTTGSYNRKEAARSYRQTAKEIDTFGSFALATQPPAADGKLLNAIEARRATYAAKLVDEKPTKAWADCLRFAVEVLDGVKYDAGIRPLAQPASGGGEKTKENQNG